MASINLISNILSVCETIAYLYLGCVIGAIVMFYITFKHRREFLEFFNSGIISLITHQRELNYSMFYRKLH